MNNEIENLSSVGSWGAKKCWYKPELYIIGNNTINSGNAAGSVEGKLTPHATPPVTANSVYHS